MKNKRQIKDNKIIEDAIAHLNGYITCIKMATGYNPIAVLDCIEGLRRMKK